jgi:hypothetical protein
LNFFGNKQDTQPKQVETFPFSIRDADTTFKMLSTDDQGQVLVIKGIVKKNIKKPLKNLQIEIRILDKNRQVIATKTVYAGNIPIDADFNSKKEPDIDAILMDGSKTLGVLSQMDEIPFSVAFYGTQALSTASIQAEVKEFVWQ